MLGKKELLSKVLYRARLFEPLERLRRDLVLVFGWHRVLPDGPRPPNAWADDVFGPTVSELDRVIGWLARHTRVLSEDQLTAVASGALRPGGLASVVTFDDGYADNHALALPVLERHGVPAIFFIPTRRIEERDVGWVDLIPWALKHTHERTLTIAGLTFRLPEERADAVAYLHRRMQLSPEHETRELVPDLFASLRLALPTREEQGRELMTWEQLRDAERRGMAISSHTHSHRVLSTLPEDAQRAELERSRDLLSERLGAPPRTIAYPVGGYRHFDSRTQRLARSTGYTLGFSYCTGFNRFGAIAPFDVKRIGPPIALELFAGTAVLPELFDWDDGAAYGEA